MLDLKFAKNFSSKDYAQIEQGYLAFSKGMSVRVRSLIKNEATSWLMTFKQKVGNRIIEIEKKISERDGKDLWSVCVGKIKKIRHYYRQKGLVWEIDFFYKSKDLYLIVVELEMDEGQERPKKLPALFADYVIYEVPFNDGRFANKKLSDIDYATKLYKEIKNV